MLLKWSRNIGVTSIGETILYSSRQGYYNKENLIPKEEHTKRKDTYMPRDPRKHQKALMKKRSKQKAALQQRQVHRQASASSSPQTILLNAHTLPLLECHISANWQKDDMGLIQILIARQQPDGNICFGTYLIDKYCLGLKNTFANANFSRTRYRNEIYNRMSQRQEMKECSVELAHQMIYEAIDYAAQFGFQPEKDFANSQYMLAPRGELEEPYHLTFGKDGKPFFIAGPHDNVTSILRQLDKTAGSGNYHFIAPIGMP